MKKIIDTYKIIIIGKVQGVGYRYWFKKNSIQFNLNGYVKNLEKINNVEALVQGKIFNIDQIIKKSYHGPKLAKIDKIIIEKIKTNKIYSDFKIMF
tara:strand:+ start:132 stop:419 length:288 start_codon:yes stop_codon:yes gene_type:complete